MKVMIKWSRVLCSIMIREKVAEAEIAGKITSYLWESLLT